MPMTISRLQAVMTILQWVWIFLFLRDSKQKLIIIKDRRPELTIQVAESYYTNNLSGQEGFALADGFYSKTIAEDDLEFTFSDDPDGTSTKIFNEILKLNFKNKNCIFFSEIILSYTLATGSSGTDFSLDDSVTIRFVKIHINWIDKI